MIKITKVYTRKGDKGNTTLARGVKIKKDHIRIQAIGEVDELNSVLGVVATTLNTVSNDFSVLLQNLQRIQNELFDLGAELSVLDTHSPRITQNHVTMLESEIDQMNKSLPILHSFVLPGGSLVSAYLHLARTICRRTERTLVKLVAEITLTECIIPYINRLSDWLFVAARFVNQCCRISEPLWEVGSNH